MPMDSVVPRVRVMAVCDQMEASGDEEHVFNLTGVRYNVRGNLFPFHRQLWLYLLLASARSGVYQGYILIMSVQTGKAIYRGRMRPKFDRDNDLLTLGVPLFCTFPRPGEYTIQVWFFRPALDRMDFLKGEQPFFVLD